MAYKEKYGYLNNQEELEKVLEEHKLKGSISEEKEQDKPQIALNFNMSEITFRTLWASAHGKNGDF